MISALTVLIYLVCFFFLMTEKIITPVMTAAKAITATAIIAVFVPFSLLLSFVVSVTVSVAEGNMFMKKAVIKIVLYSGRGLGFSFRFSLLFNVYFF